MKKEVKKFLYEIVGDEGMKVISMLNERSATDAEIAEKTGLRVNAVRKVLYKLYDHHLATYVRTRDKESGWYTYTWTLNLDRSMDIIETKKEKAIKRVEEKIRFYEETAIYECPRRCYEYTFEQASEANFRCMCGEPLNYSDPSEKIEKLRLSLKKICGINDEDSIRNK
ncbi:MAG: transcription factor [Candidatus Hydrothermarchaeota archaeon]